MPCKGFRAETMSAMLPVSWALAHTPGSSFAALSFHYAADVSRAQTTLERR
jgi:hypothetical protein